MFEHAALKPLWPVILFLPWVLVGVAYLVESVLHWRSGVAAAYQLRHLRPGGAARGTPRTEARHRAWFSGEALMIVSACLLLTATSSALADAAPQANQPCPASTQEQARWLGDALFEQGAYRRAGECYEAAGDHDLANRAFLRAVAPESAATARQLSDQRDQAKELLRKVQHAFHDH